MKSGRLCAQNPDGMSKTTKIPSILKINQVDGWRINVVFSNGEYRTIDFEQFFQEHNFSNDPLRAKLLDQTFFQSVALHEGTLRWPTLLQKIELSNGMTFEVPFDLDPIVLYDQSTPDLNRNPGVNVGEVLRQARKEAGLTQEELAKRSGTTKHYISRIENHHADIEVGTLQKIVELGLGKQLEIQVK